MTHNSRSHRVAEQAASAILGARREALPGIAEPEVERRACFAVIDSSGCRAVPHLDLVAYRIANEVEDGLRDPITFALPSDPAHT